jgi:hypothetical protein
MQVAGKGESVGWSAYEVFAVISGVVLLAWAFLDDGGDDEELTPAIRMAGGATGIGLIGYGFYVANQDSGVWTFPVLIFVLPLLAVWRIATRLIESGALNSPAPAKQEPVAGSGASQTPAPGATDVSGSTPDHRSGQLPGVTAPVPVPGWYRDPGGSGWLRWWDGGTWSEHTRPGS